MLRTFTTLTPWRSFGQGATESSTTVSGLCILPTWRGWPSTAGSASSAAPTTGFEVVSRRHGRRWQIAAMALRAAPIGLAAQAHVSRVEFATPRLYPSKSTEKSSTWSPIQGSASTVLHTPSPLSAGQRRFRLRTDASHATSPRVAVGAGPKLLRIPCGSDADALVVMPVMMSAA